MRLHHPSSNAWAPLQELLVTGLENAGTPEAKKLALKIARKWIYQNWAAYDQTDIMYEKYDVTQVSENRSSACSLNLKIIL